MTDQYQGIERRTVDKEIATLQADVRHLEKTVESMGDDVKQLVALANQSKGGWKVILLVAGVAGTAGAALAKVLPFLGALPK